MKFVETIPPRAEVYSEMSGGGVWTAEDGTLVTVDLGSRTDLRAFALVIVVGADPTVVVSFFQEWTGLVGSGQCQSGGDDGQDERDLGIGMSCGF